MAFSNLSDKPLLFRLKTWWRDYKTAKKVRISILWEEYAGLVTAIIWLSLGFNLAILVFKTMQWIEATQFSLFCFG